MAKHVSEPERLFGEERHWSERRVSFVAGITAAEAVAGGKILDGGEAELRGHSDNLVSLQAQVAGADAAIAEARVRRRAAILAVQRADAEALRAQAGTLRAEAVARQEKIGGILSELSQLEGVEYSNKPSRVLVPDWRAGVFVSDDDLFLVATPKTAGLLAEADRLEREAEQLEQRQVQDSGALGAQTRDDLLAQFSGLDPLRIGPALADVHEWLAKAALSAEEQLRIRVARDEAGATLRYEVVWVGGEVVCERSSVNLIEHSGRVPVQDGEIAPVEG